MGRRVFLSAGAAVLAVLSGTTQAQTNDVQTGSISAELRNVATLDRNVSGPPDYLTTDGIAGDNRLFVVGQSGQIKIIDSGSLVATPFIDMNTALGSQFLHPGDERGLLGLAFSPNYATDGKIYTFTSENPGISTNNAPTFSQPELGAGNGSTQTVIREWTVSSNSNVVDPNSSRVLMRIRKPQDNHNGGSLAFGPDNYLYISLGDGGGGNDNSGGVSSTTDGHSNSVSQSPALPTPPGNAQDITNVYGKILRILPTTTDATNTTALSSNGAYRIPNANPFSGNTAGVDEIFAFGLRNPYRMSFDTATGKLYAADVGQGAQEEVDVIVNGGNYGWVLKEGTADTSGIGGPYATPSNLISPIAAYTHADGIAAIGGFVYHGSLIPALEGKYVFGDLGGSSNGRLFYMDVADHGANSDPPTNTVFELDVTGSFGVPVSDLHGFGQDANGEIYALFDSGQVVELVPEPTTIALATLGAALVLFQIRRGKRTNLPAD